MKHSKNILKILICGGIIFASLTGVKSQSTMTASTPPTARKPLIGVSPALVIADIQPGKTFTQSFTLENSSTDYVRFRCTLGDYWFDKNNAPVLAPAGTLTRSASSWIQFSPTEIVVAPHTSTVVKALISVPQNAVGGYYSMPFFEAEAAEPPNLGQAAKGEVRASSSIVVQIGGLFVLATEKISDYNVEIVNEKVSPPTAVSELEVALDFFNHGNVHAFLKSGVFAILDTNGKLVGQGKLEDRLLLPTQTKTLKGTWSGDLPAGDYSVISTISFERAGLTPSSIVSEIPLRVVK